MKFSLRVIFWVLLAAVPAFACDPMTGVNTAAFPVFAIGFVAMFVSWAVGGTAVRVGRPLGWVSRIGVTVVYISAGLIVAGLMLVLSFSAFSLMNIWVIGLVLHACLEYLFREEVSWKEFHHCHRRLVNLALFLFLGGLALKYLSLAGEDPLDFLHDDRMVFFVTYLVIGLSGLAIGIPVYWYRRRVRKGSGQVFPGTAPQAARGFIAEGAVSGSTVVLATVEPNPIPQPGE